MKKGIVLVGLLMLILVLAACGSTLKTASGAGENGGGAQSTDLGSAAGAKIRLTEDYADALPVQTQLALGTMQLEETDLAIDEALAAELLPLWRATQSLNNSDAAAEAEISAVFNQIQDTMAPEQIIAIAGMKLTEESLTAMVEEDELTFGHGGGDFADSSGGDHDSGGGGFAGGGPGGDHGPGGGGGFSGGGGFTGGGPGGGFANLSEDDSATRQAEFAESGFGGFREQALTGAVIQLLEVKTGVALESGPRGIFGTVFTIVSKETGLSVEELQAKTAAGSTLAEIVEANGGDVEAAHASLVEALNDLPNAVDLDAEELASDWLSR